MEHRSSHPLITLISPSKQSEIVRSLLDVYKHEGYLPDARSGNCNGRTQGGSNAEVLIADAYAKGLKGIDYGLALKAMLKDATIHPGGNEEKEGRGGLEDYNNIGYVSTDFVRSGNRTVEYAYDDYCLAMVAKGLNRMEEYRRFLNVYIKSASLNGKPFDQAWIEHQDIVNGGELVLEMGPQPSNWGTKLMPPSTK
jgi:putative alpha-1,2-mannosidase